MLNQILNYAPPSAKDLLRKRIERFEWLPGNLLPVESQLSAELGISKPTIHRAIRELVDEQLVVAVPGKKRRLVRSFSDTPKTYVIGLLHYDVLALSHPVMQQFLSGVEECVRSHGYRLRIESGSHSEAIVKPLPDMTSLHEMCRGIDGLIVHWESDDIGPVRKLSAHLPIILSDHESLSPIIHGIRFDHEDAFFQLAEILLQAGHQRIGRIGLPESHRLGFAQETGVRLAVRRRVSNRDVRHVTLEIEENDKDLAYEAVLEHIRLGTLPTGLICASDDAALGTMEALAESGLAVPDDVSVVVFGGKPPAFDLPRAFTAVRGDFRMHGRSIAEALLALIESARSWGPDGNSLPTRQDTEHTPCHFVQGDTVAKPRPSN
ncbi:MAG: GntR family transcriptional regulator [Terrimicrobiaceae bacterium]